jgi:hypothetical protein
MTRRTFIVKFTKEDIDTFLTEGYVEVESIIDRIVETAKKQGYKEPQRM